MEDKDIIKNLIDKARIAQKQIENYSQEQIDEVCQSVAWQVYNDENISQLARLAVDETKMGVYEDKIKKQIGRAHV